MDTATSIRDYIRDELLIGDDASIDDDTPLWGGVVDSVGLMQLISFIEERYAIEVSDDELTSTHFRTIADIAALVDRKIAGA